MSPLQCLFCDQPNPDAAKFCNECGTPLHFKPCPQCDGINGRFAESCYRCGAAFSPIARESDETLSPLREVSGPVPSVASPIDRLEKACKDARSEAHARRPFCVSTTRKYQQKTDLTGMRPATLRLIPRTAVRFGGEPAPDLIRGDASAPVGVDLACQTTPPVALTRS